MHMRHIPRAHPRVLVARQRRKHDNDDGDDDGDAFPQGFGDPFVNDPTILTISNDPLLQPTISVPPALPTIDVPLPVLSSLSDPLLGTLIPPKPNPKTTTIDSLPLITQATTANGLSSPSPQTSVASLTTTLSSPLSVSSLQVTSPTLKAISSAAVPSATASPVPSSGKSGATAGGVFAGLVGLGVMGAFVLWLVRHFRRKSAERDAFNSTSFRNFLDNPPLNDTAPEMTSAPSVPPASFPYGEIPQNSSDPFGQYSARAAQYNISAYGTDGQTARQPWTGENNFQYGSPYSQRARMHPYGPQFTSVAPPVLPKDDYSLREPQQLAARSSPPPPNHQFGARANMPNPFANPPSRGPTTTATAAIAAARAAATSPGPSVALSVKSTAANAGHTHADSVTLGTPSPTSSSPPLSRNNTGRKRVPVPSVEYADVQRETAPVVAPLVPAKKSSGPRPGTVYDEADAYDGI